MSEEFDPRDLNAQEAATRKTDDARRLQRQIEEDDFKELMQHPWGRRLMWRLLGMTGVYRNPFVGSREATDFRCGEQNIGQMLMADIHELCPEMYHVMVKEQQSDGRRKSASPTE